MTDTLDWLEDGYRRFRKNTLKPLRDRYETLADEGQKPRVMVIGCADSRADPALIFDAGPGEIFTVRNVANLVPPPEPDQHHHGTSAAIEFAVTGLGVETILVMGHAQCGGVAAFLKNYREGNTPNNFVGRWVALLEEAMEDMDEKTRALPDEDLLPILEKRAVETSLGHLLDFPFVAERETAGTLTLLGGYFGIKSGVLELAHAPLFDWQRVET